MDNTENDIVVHLKEDGFIAFCKVRQMCEVVRTLRGEVEAVPKLRLRY